MKNLKGKKVVITGGASGIGRCAAERFYEEGAVLCLVDMPDLQKTELTARFPERMTYIQGDITTKETQNKIKEWANNNGVDALINNAGITRDATMFKMTDEQWDQVVAVNLTAAFRVARDMAGVMKEKKIQGAIINVASVVAHYGNFGQCNYVATKAGIIGLTKTMAKELARSAIRVNAVAPGFIGTPMVKAMPEKVLTMMTEKVPMQRLGEPEEIAAAFAFLASDDAKYITGTCLNVDGGIVL